MISGAAFKMPRTADTGRKSPDALKMKKKKKKEEEKTTWRTMAADTCAEVGITQKEAV